MKKAILGLFISALLIYLSVKDTDFQRVIYGMTKMGYGYILPFLLITLLMQALRAWRWGLILRPLGKLGQMRILAIASVGFLAITALPARLGELLRPYLVARSSDISMSAALGTVFVERFLDCVTILAIASLTAFFAALPPWLAKAGFVFLLFNLALLAVIFCAVFRRPFLESFVHYFIRRWPASWSERLSQLFRHFLDGFRIVGDGSRLWQVLLLSCLIWLVNGLAIYALFQAFDFSLSPVAAFVLMIVLIIGIAIPTAPGFIGNWHFSC
ncbi:MAG: lysylphosphatidylglycerol synthase transmembrane domain-containing protein, partial [Syntrophales bacterium]|nr:lysylphosphatidylglycerol synthase transmembrane domain-containing protein [Syntrophales bacterium]